MEAECDLTGHKNKLKAGVVTSPEVQHFIRLRNIRSVAAVAAASAEPLAPLPVTYLTGKRRNCAKICHKPSNSPKH